MRASRLRKRSADADCRDRRRGRSLSLLAYLVVRARAVDVCVPARNGRIMSSSVCHAPLPARMEAFTTRLCLRAVDQYERLLQTHFNKVRARHWRTRYPRVPRRRDGPFQFPLQSSPPARRAAQGTILPSLARIFHAWRAGVSTLVPSTAVRTTVYTRSCVYNMRSALATTGNRLIVGRREPSMICLRASRGSSSKSSRKRASRPNRAT